MRQSEAETRKGEVVEELGGQESVTTSADDVDVDQLEFEHYPEAPNGKATRF